jgi:YHS domain-containing protein
MKLKQALIVASGFAIASAAYAAKGEYGDMCVTGMSMGKSVPTDCTNSTQVDGKTYCFSGPEAKAMFEKDPKGTIAKANETYAKLKN